jgi:hypothetical protein
VDIGEHYPSETLVFLDEAACNRLTSNRLKAWAPIGERAHQHDYFVRGQRYSILPAISLDGVLHLDILMRPWTAEEFRLFIDVLLDKMNPYPEKNSVLILDNASAHHFDGLREMVEGRGVTVLACICTNSLVVCAVIASQPAYLYHCMLFGSHDLTVM